MKGNEYFMIHVYSAEERVQDLSCLARLAVEKSLLHFGQLLRKALWTVLGVSWDRDT